MNTAQTRPAETPLGIPDGVAFTPVPLYRHPPESKPAAAPAPSPKIAIAYGLMVAIGTGVIGLTMYRAGVSAGEFGSAATIQQLESQTAATQDRIKSFCSGAQ